MPTLQLEFDTAARALAADGWCVMPGLLTPTQTGALADECQAMHAAQRLVPAATGAGRTLTALRGDRTRWFEPTALTAAQRPFAEGIDRLRLALNRKLMLGLIDSESHYALYRPGAGYARHRDCLRGSDVRTVSAVFYLNQAWQEADGGALRLYLTDRSHHDIYPHAGALLLFLSAQFEHEVLPASRDRLSIACWLRQRPIAVGR